MLQSKYKQLVSPCARLTPTESFVTVNRSRKGVCKLCKGLTEKLFGGAIQVPVVARKGGTCFEL